MMTWSKPCAGGLVGPVFPFVTEKIAAEAVVGSRLRSGAGDRPSPGENVPRSRAAVRALE